MIDQRVSALKDQRGHVFHELELARKHPGMYPYREPGHVEGLRDELAAIDGELETLYGGMMADQLTRAGIRQATPAESQAIENAHKSLEQATAEGEASVQAHAAKVRQAARELYEAQAAAGQNARYPIIWHQARNRLANAARQAFEN